MSITSINNNLQITQEGANEMSNKIDKTVVTTLEALKCSKTSIVPVEKCILTAYNSCVKSVYEDVNNYVKENGKINLDATAGIYHDIIKSVITQDSFGKCFTGGTGTIVSCVNENKYGTGVTQNVLKQLKIQVVGANDNSGNSGNNGNTGGNSGNNGNAGGNSGNNGNTGGNSSNNGNAGGNSGNNGNTSTTHYDMVVRPAPPEPFIFSDTASYIYLFILFIVIVVLVYLAKTSHK